MTRFDKLNKIAKELQIDDLPSHSEEKATGLEVTLTENAESTSIVLTDGQAEALERMVKWSYSQRPFFTLKGSAGTGKTTLIREFLKFNKYKRNVCVTAPTHKAKKVIQQVTHSDSHTIQSILGLRPNTNLENFDVNNPQFDVLADPKMEDYPLFIIDEGSMLGNDLTWLLIEKAEEHNVKILFVGDPFQLPPVKEYASPVFIGVVKNDRGKPINFPLEQYELTEIVRQGKDNPLAILLNLLRYDINTYLRMNDKNYLGDIAKTNNKYYYDNLITSLKVYGYDDIIPKVEANKDNPNLFFGFINSHKKVINDQNKKGYTIVNVSEFKQYIDFLFTLPAYKENPDLVKFAAWTNQTVGIYNKHIRQIMYGEKANDFFIPGELLMSYDMVVSPEEDNTLLVSNSEDLIVDRFEEYTSFENIKGYKVYLKSTDGSFVSEPIFFVHPDDISNYLNVFDEKLEDAKSYRGSYWKRFYRFKYAHILRFDIKAGRRMISKKSFDSGTGITVHKTQGSTYTFICVNGVDINRNPDVLERKKLWYVALSRATDKAIILL